MKRSLEKTFVWVKCLENIGSAWFFSTYVLFLVGIGLDLLQITLANAIYMTIRTLFDPITGNLGDRIGQKKIYMAGLFFWAIGTGVYSMATGFWMCAVSEGISAIGFALRSQALESWLLNHSDKSTSLRAQSNAGFWARLATIPTAILGGIVGTKWGLQWPWLLSGITCILALILTWFLLRHFPEKAEKEIKTEESLDLRVIAKKAWGDIVLRRVFIITAILCACFQSFNMFWPIVFKSASGSGEWLGSVWVGIAITSAIGSKLAQKWKINSRALALIIALIGLPMLLPQIPGYWVLMILSPFMFHEIGRSMWEPVLWNYANTRIPDGTRNSVNSLTSASESAGALFGLLAAGLLSKCFSPTTIWGISALALILTSLWVYRWNHD